MYLSSFHGPVPGNVFSHFPLKPFGTMIAL